MHEALLFNETNVFRHWAISEGVLKMIEVDILYIAMRYISPLHQMLIPFQLAIYFLSLQLTKHGYYNEVGYITIKI